MPDSTQHSGLRVLVVGRTDLAEFHDAVGWLDGVCQLDHCETVEEACQVGSHRPPDVFIVLQPRPGSVSTQAINQLHSSAPLAGLLALLGSWCEGEPRTGYPLQWRRTISWSWRAAASSRRGLPGRFWPAGVSWPVCGPWRTPAGSGARCPEPGAHACWSCDALVFALHLR